MLHLVLHIFVPAVLAFLYYKPDWLRVWFWWVAAFLIDLDHLFADPIYDPDRCSVGFHFLHSYLAIAIYFGLLFFPRLRIIAWGLIIHIVLDYLDCIF